VSYYKAEHANMMHVVQDDCEIDLFCSFVTGGSVLMHAFPCTLLILFYFKTCFHYKYAKNPFNTLTGVCFSAPTLRFCSHGDQPRGSAMACPFLSITKVKVNLVGCDMV
jgi:hypothetical protein